MTPFIFALKRHPDSAIWVADPQGGGDAIASHDNTRMKRPCFPWFEPKDIAVAILQRTIFYHAIEINLVE